ncbi:MAG: Peptidase S58 family protein [Xylanivirga thermophila]|uniref:P1 family peptidase n=1 Tax=Xylanivirga thermophila TaxID=2496273 RepID=UPI0039F4F74E
MPIVPGAVLFDLAYGDSSIRPDAQMGYMACKNASAKEVSQGIVGAGAGATVGKILGMDFCMKGGIGTASIKLPSGVIVGAIVAVNAFGDVIDIENGNILAGARHPDNKGVFLNTKEFLFKKDMNIEFSSTNTTIGVVATNAKLSKEGANKLASMAHDGLAISISPVHTMVDGDTLFCLSTGDKKEDINILGMAAVEVVARAVNNAVLSVMPKR